MPTPRGAPTRASHRRNSQQDDTPARTRAARGAKPAPAKSDGPEMVPPKSSPTKLSPTLTRKTTRSASNISGNSFENAPEIYPSYEHPLFMVFGLSREFFDGLKKHHGKLPKERKIILSAFSQRSTSPEDPSESEQEESDDESEIEVPSAHPANRGSRGRGRGARAGRARGSRGRGRGGRARGASARLTSPARSRLSRNAAPAFPLTEEDEDQPSNQSSRNTSAKPPTRPYCAQPLSTSGDEHDHVFDEDRSEISFVASKDAHTTSTTPLGPPPDGLLDSILDGSWVPPPPETTNSVSKRLAATSRSSNPKLALPPKSTSQTPLEAASTPAEYAVPKLLDPDDDELSDSDLPEPFIYDAPSPVEADCEDRADYLLQKKFKPMVDVHQVIATLTKYAANQRSTESLYALAENTQRILKAWQDEYLMLDARTAPHMHPPKKPCNGGRIPLAPDVFEDMKEADLYGYNHDAKKLPGCQDPWAQRPGAEKTGRRELRTRRTRDMLDSAAPSDEDEEEDGDGRPSKRQRRATRKFDGAETASGATTPKKHNGWGGARKKGVSRFSKPTSETPDPEERPTKRARIAASNLLHQRIQEMREESILGSSGDEESSAMDVDEYADVNPKRGRPAGSKNVARRSDFGVKKGPRKKPNESVTPDQAALGGAGGAPTTALNSMSEGQGQFTVDPQPLAEETSPAFTSAETVPHGASQVLPSQEAPLMHPSETSTPDAYMITAPLSQYTNNYVEDSSPLSGSRRKPRVKSEKRSQSMTIWWAERKARKKEQDEKDGKPIQSSASRSNSATRKAGRVSTGSIVAAATPQPQPMPAEAQQTSPIHHPQHLPPAEAYHAHYPQHSPPAQHYMYVSGPPPHHMMMQYSPLAALPSGSFAGYSGPAPPNAQYGARVLAPAPIQLQHMPTYPSPYGPQSPVGPRPQSSAGPQGRIGPPPLAPAPPQHYSPYAPMDRPFKVMIPGSAPAERRESR
ncbi:hypothetical protein ACN47E_004950 [Coniothyrium glycines]